ncbi:unnamed protein product [Rotaria sp. Silwood1]|nr:unnamed protein product [Rotaria sp. Silwood1]CAF1434082.1 unnamed protein product [Rotaria sp. Silwood1]CAF3577085.1 unnamed protein product [Rotaria sp. Silwood1]CAF3633571.1 unnamed protein product [Rotaria sp. Silwood1]CAF4559090.1 unnamed protein product [Rotaria sp. Silwood1]
MALYFFSQGLNEQQTSDIFILNEVYNFQHECQTSDQVKPIRDDDNAMRMHALLVNEQIFLEHENVSNYIDLIEKLRDYFYNHHLFHRSLQLYLAEYQLTRFKKIASK